MIDHPLQQLVARHKAGQSIGIFSVCSAHPMVLEAAFRQARADGSLLLIEATCNQVNQFGGYTGLRPADFASQVRGMAATYDFPPERLILGGDHLGPSPWQGEVAASALKRAESMVREFAAVGYTKIHLDASMSCCDDPHPLPDKLVAERAARLAAACEAERGRGGSTGSPVYVVGTEVPTPGGAQGPDEKLRVTPVSEVAETLANARKAFLDHDLQECWKRVVAVVVQPGVEFGSDSVVDYDRAAAGLLSEFVSSHPRIVYEAHSTDYQKPEALRALVEDHFCILKVGPWLTFALREAIYALAAIESESLGRKQGVSGSEIRQTVERVMLDRPSHWAKHYRGNALEQRLQRTYSFSDRVRYYWTQPEIRESLQRLFHNLTEHPIPDPLLSQFLPAQYQAHRSGRISKEPRELVVHRVREVLQLYSSACGGQVAGYRNTL